MSIDRDPTRPSVKTVIFFWVAGISFLSIFVIIQIFFDQHPQTFIQFQGCGTVTSSIVKGSVGHLPPNSHPVIIFNVDGRDCDLKADESFWIRTKLGEKHIVSGVKNYRICTVEFVGKEC